MTYRAELSGRALKQMSGLPGPAFDRLIEAMGTVWKSYAIIGMEWFDKPADPANPGTTSPHRMSTRTSWRLLSKSRSPARACRLTG